MDKCRLQNMLFLPTNTVRPYNIVRKPIIELCDNDLYRVIISNESPLGIGTCKLCVLQKVEKGDFTLFLPKCKNMKSDL